MSYLGQSAFFDPTTRTTPTTVQVLSGDGSTTAFQLNFPVTLSTDILVVIENVVQQPDYAYTVSNSILVFTSPPPTGTNNIYVEYNRVTALTGVIPDASITLSKLANNLRNLATDQFTGNGVATQYTLSDIPTDANNLIVTIGGVGQASPSNYTVSGSTITFTSAPANNTPILVRNIGLRTAQSLYSIQSGTSIVQPNISGGYANNITLNNATLNSANLVFSDSVQNTAAYTGNRNRIINGNMLIWQRGTSFTNPQVGGNFFTADRWGVNRASDFLGATVSQSTDVPTGFRYSLKLQRTAGDANTQGLYIFNSNETNNTIDLAGQPITLSFYAKKGANYSGGTLNISVISGTGIDEKVYAYTGSTGVMFYAQTISSTWTRYSFTGTVPSNSKELGFIMYWTPTGTAGADDSVYITGIQLEKGSVATPFEFRPYGTELALCQRYYEKSYAIGTAPNTNTWVGMQQGLNGTDGNQINGIRFIVPKRTGPIMTIISKGGSNATLSNTSGNDGPNGGSWVAYDVGEFGFRSIVGTGGLSSSTAYCYHYTASAEL